MNCHCGKPLHYTDPKIQASVQRLVDELGEYIHVTVHGRTWLVQRHYLALHGLAGRKVARLGFQEVTGADGPAVQSRTSQEEPDKGSQGRQMKCF